MTVRQRNLGAAVLAVGLVVGLALVVFGGDDSTTTSTTGAPTIAAPTTAPNDAPNDAPTMAEGSGAPLPLGDTSIAAIEELTGLAIPAGADGYLTARLENERQLDVTFTMPASAEAAFVERSSLPSPERGRRVILHSSPLWKLTPDDGAPIRGVADVTDRVNRGVELVDEGEATVRARIVITSA